MRIRSIKPGFFKDEDLAELPALTRILFAGLWCMADREGRLEDRPRLIKVEILPYDKCDIELILNSLQEYGFIVRYEVNGIRCIQIVGFLRHQIPSRDEPQSELPSQEGNVKTYIKPPNETVRARLYLRDNYSCCYCGLNMVDKSRARCLDHIIPYSKGGSNEDDNLTTCCKKCNAKKSDKTPDEAGMPWPLGYGKRSDTEPLTPVLPPVNTPLNHCLHPVNGVLTVPDKEGEGERERELYREVGKSYPQSTIPITPEKKRFTKPRVDEVSDYAASIGFNLKGQKFLDHYDSNGWMVGKTPMKDWKATVRKWKSKQEDDTPQTSATIESASRKINFEPIYAKLRAENKSYCCKKKINNSGGGRVCSGCDKYPGYELEEPISTTG